MLTWPAKDPDEVLDYQIDWRSRLAEGETIASSTWEVADGDVVIDSDSNAGGVTTVWLSGGSVATACTLTNHIETSASRIYDQSTRLRIRNK